MLADILIRYTITEHCRIEELTEQLKYDTKVIVKNPVKVLEEEALIQMVY